MEIRRLVEKDIKEVTDLWYKVSVEAHNFVASEYWEQNKIAMEQNYLPNSETYIGIDEGKLIGFVAMIDDYLPAIFVDSQKQGKGYGKQLLNYVKTKRQKIQLNVYKKNSSSVLFYTKQGFKLLSESVAEATGEVECLMEWEKE